MSETKVTAGFSPVDSRFNETCGADDELVARLLQEILQQIAADAREGCR